MEKYVHLSIKEQMDSVIADLQQFMGSNKWDDDITMIGTTCP